MVMTNWKRYVLAALAITLCSTFLLARTNSLQHGRIISSLDKRGNGGSDDAKSSGYEAGSDTESELESRPGSSSPGSKDDQTGNTGQQHSVPDFKANEADVDPTALLSTLRKYGRRCIAIMVSSETSATKRLQRDDWIGPSEQAATPFTRIPLLKTNRWVCDMSTVVDSFEESGEVPIATAIEDLRLSLAFSEHNGPEEVHEKTLPHVDREKGVNSAVVCAQAGPYKAHGTFYQPTYIEYKFVLNPAQGVIVSYGMRDWSSTSSASSMKTLPLHLWEDVLALEMRSVWDVEEYYREHDGKPKLEYLFHVNMGADRVLHDAIHYALDVHGYENRGPSKKGAVTPLQAWKPGATQQITVKATSKGGQTIIGTPLGKSTAAFLYRNKAWLGIKQIKSITIFLDDRPERPQPALLFEIEDVEHVDQDPFDRPERKHER